MQRSSSRPLLNSFYMCKEGKSRLAGGKLDQSFGGISSVGDDFDDTRENSDTQNIGEVKNEIKRIYDST